MRRAARERQGDVADDGEVKHDRIQAYARDDAALGRRGSGLGTRPLAAGFAEALALAHQARWIKGQIVLEVTLAAEVMPIRVLAPALDRVLITERLHVLKVQHRCHKTRGQRSAPGGGDELWAPFVGEGFPIDQITEPNQFVVVVDEVDQICAEKVMAVCRFHKLRR